MIHSSSWTKAGSSRPLLRTLNKHCTTALVSIRPASLSAIHRGVRQSERAQFEDHNSTRNSKDRSFRDSRRDGLTSKALDGASSLRQRQKLRKKLDRKTNYDDGEDSSRQTRRKRFLDPESSFGKQSIVYQLKHGALRDEAANLELDEPVRPKFRSTRPASGDNRHGGDSRCGGDRRRGSDNHPSQFTRKDARPSDFHQHRIGRDIRPSRSQFGSEQKDSPEFDEEGSADRGMPVRGPRKPMMAMTIKYTTAASQFLYGKAVVRAALEQRRRKLYHLYIYGGENRKDSKDNTIMTRLAEQNNLPVTVVPNGEQRLMDKMSMGRPHNGFVLESSPLPQLPVVSLGRLEETASKLGFHVELDFQSKEEEAVNGKDTFVERSSDLTPKPFVLLLNEILDPGNLGALLRTASYMGVDAVGITNRSSSALTPVVLKSAAGAVEEITIFTVDSPVKFLEESRSAGWKVYAAVAPPDRKLVQRHSDKFLSTDTIEHQNPLNTDPCILVLGNEGHGLSKPVKMAANYEVSIPRYIQKSCVDSLNVSVAAGILCQAFVKERISAQGKGEVVGGNDGAEPSAGEQFF